MSQDRTTENVHEISSASGLSDGDAWTDSSDIASEYVTEAEPSAEDCGLNDPRDRCGDADSGRLPGDDKTVNKP